MQNKIKICFILSHLPQGGAERQTINLIKKLNPLKYDITLLLYSNKNIFYKDIFNFPIKVITNCKPKSKYKIIRNFKDAYFLKNHLRQNTYDILHTLLFHNGFWVRLVAPGKYNKRIIYSIRNNLKDSNLFFRFFERLFAKKSIIITNNIQSKNQMLKLLGQKYEHRIINIYNGIDINLFNKEFSPINNKIILGTVGRMTTQKNQIQILRVLNKLKTDLNFNFYLIGDINSDRSSDIINYINENELENFITVLDSQPSIEKFYAKFDIFILSSFYEGCPNALFEALLSRCLCIVSEGANSDEFIKDGINGLVYDGTDEMLEIKINEAILLLKSNKAKGIVTNGYNYALENFSIDKMVTSYENIYDNTLK